MLDSIIAIILYSFTILPLGYWLLSRYLTVPVYMRWALAYGLGTLLLTGQLFIYFFICRWPVSWWLYGFLFLQAAIATGRLWFHRRRFFAPDKTALAKPWRGIDKVLGIVVAIVISASCLQAITRPPLGYDAMVIWSLRAKILLRDGRVDFNPQSYTYLSSPHYQFYPWHTSLAEYWLRQLGGGEEVVNLLPWGYFFTLLLLLYGYLVRYHQRSEALLLILFLSTMPLLFYHSFTTYADVPLAYYVTVAGLLWLWWLDEKNPLYLFLSALYIGASFFVKNEGIFFIFAWLLSVVIARPVLSKRQLGKVATALLLPSVAWLVFRVIYHLPLDNTTLVVGWHPEVWTSLRTTFFVHNSWNIWWYLVVVTLVVRIRTIWRERQWWPWWSFFFGSIGSFLILYFFTQRSEHALNFTAIGRTSLALVPLSLLALSVAWRNKTSSSL